MGTNGANGSRTEDACLSHLRIKIEGKWVRVVENYFEKLPKPAFIVMSACPECLKERERRGKGVRAQST